MLIEIRSILVSDSKHKKNSLQMCFYTAQKTKGGISYTLNLCVSYPGRSLWNWRQRHYPGPVIPSNSPRVNPLDCVRF